MAAAPGILDLLADRRMALGPDEVQLAGRHWRLGRDGDGVAWALFDREGESVNTLSEAVLEELDAVLAGLEREPPKGLALRSAKPSGFAAGADVRDFRGIDAAAAKPPLQRAHAVLDRLAALPFPTVAVLHGFCLGGGLELALACRHRLAVDGARLGFPEVLLGLHPGLGGSARATALIDPIQAMRLMLTGRTVDARRARSLGLVDAVLEERHVGAAVAAAIAGRVKRRRPGWRNWARKLAPLRRLVAGRMRSQAAARADPRHYPAPFALIDLWQAHGGGMAEMRRAEIGSFVKLIAGDTAQNLIQAFFLRERLKAMAKGEAAIRHVHVVGAGTMGGDIAAWCAARGLRVSLTDLDPEALAAAVGRANALFERRLGKGMRAREARDRLLPDFGGDGARAADLAIEAVPERLELKQRVLRSLEQRLPPGAILATNTSSIPIDQLAERLERPERFLGLHFFNPVDRMQLVELVRHARLDSGVLARAGAFCGLIDRLPAPVTSRPGFLVNRVLTPYLLEAVALLDKGVAPETVDRAATGFGMAMGPVEVADRVGLDICLHVAEVLRAELQQPLGEIPDWFRRKVEQGELGAKSGKGFYTWRQGRPRRAARAAEPEPELAERLILPLVNACVACLREGVAADAELIDGAVIFATGFAPFRGGPLAYARARGVDETVAALRRLAAAHGPRFTPDEGWPLLRETP